MTDATPTAPPVVIAPKPKKDFWGPFRNGFKNFLGQTRKASAAGITTAVGTTGAVLGAEISSGGTGAIDAATLVFTFIGSFIAGFAAAYATSNAS
jgi:hypothetical protein